MADQIAMPSAECTGVDVEIEGVKVGSYDARDGYVTVENRAQADLVRKQVGAGGRVYGFARSTAPSMECESDGCHREIFVVLGPRCWRHKV